SRSVTAAMFLLNLAFAGGTRWLERCSDSRVAKFSGQTSHGTMKVTQIFALFGHSIGLGRPTAFLPALSFRAMAKVHSGDCRPTQPSRPECLGADQVRNASGPVARYADRHARNASVKSRLVIMLALDLARRAVR